MLAPTTLLLLLLLAMALLQQVQKHWLPGLISWQSGSHWAWHDARSPEGTGWRDGGISGCSVCWGWQGVGEWEQVQRWSC